MQRYSGSHAPGTAAGTVFGSLELPELGGPGRAVWNGFLGGPGVTSADEAGIWASDGAAGVSQDFGLARVYALNRALRFGDGPDEVHRNQVAKLELRGH